MYLVIPRNTITKSFLAHCHGSRTMLVVRYLRQIQIQRPERGRKARLYSVMMAFIPLGSVNLLLVCG